MDNESGNAAEREPQAITSAEVGSLTDVVTIGESSGATMSVSTLEFLIGNDGGDVVVIGGPTPSNAGLDALMGSDGDDDLGPLIGESHATVETPVATPLPLPLTIACYPNNVLVTADLVLTGDAAIDKGTFETAVTGLLETMRGEAFGHVSKYPQAWCDIRFIHGEEKPVIVAGPLLADERHVIETPVGNQDPERWTLDDIRKRAMSPSDIADSLEQNAGMPLSAQQQGLLQSGTDLQQFGYTSARQRYDYGDQRQGQGQAVDPGAHTIHNHRNLHDAALSLYRAVEHNAPRQELDALWQAIRRSAEHLGL